MGDEKRPHCPTGGGVHIIKSGANWVPGGPESSQNDLEESGEESEVRRFREEDEKRRRGQRQGERGGSSTSAKKRR